MIADSSQVGRLVPVLIALGANTGDPLTQLRRAVARLSIAMEVSAVSDVYVTEPVGQVRDQPDFYNLVLSGVTGWTAYGLLELGHRIEMEMGRMPGVVDGPRPIDVDLIAFGELALESDRLTLPHPRLHQRVFVLIPLAQVAPDWRHPILQVTPGELLQSIDKPTRIDRWGALEG